MKIKLNILMPSLVLMAFSFLQFGFSAETHLVTNQNAVNSHTASWLVDSTRFQSEPASNGLVCELKLQNVVKEDYSKITCVVSISNRSTNTFESCWVHYDPSYLIIELLDSDNKPVNRTANGIVFNKYPNQQQLKEQISTRYREWITNRARTPGFRPIFPLAENQISINVCLSDLFHLDKSGVFTLKVLTPLIQNQKTNKNADFKIIWLPPVVAKIQIRSGDILPASQTTNSAN
jgi:hypothetical protein